MSLTKSKQRTRQPNRKRATGSVSIPWRLYDRLDALASAENASIAQVIDGLVDHYEQTTGTRTQVHQPDHPAREREQPAEPPPQSEPAAVAEPEPEPPVAPVTPPPEPEPPSAVSPNEQVEVPPAAPQQEGRRRRRPVAGQVDDTPPPAA